MKLFTLALSNIKHNVKKYAMYFFAMCFCVFTTYSFLALTMSETVLDNIKDSSNFTIMFTGFGIVILVFVLFFLISSNNSFIRSRKKEISMYSLFGMQNSRIGMLMFLETITIGFVALVVGIGLGIFFSKLLTMMLLKMVMAGYSGDIKFAIEKNAVWITALIYVSIFCIMGVSGTWALNRFQLVDLFKASKVSESKNKGSYVMLVISVLLIVSGYIGATSQYGGVVIVLTLPITIIVIVGTYLFFLGGLQKILHLLKRNKKSYYQKTNLISISFISHKARTMATMMATIAVLVAIATTAISFGYVLYQNAESQTSEQINFDLWFYTDDETLKEDVYKAFENNNVEITEEITFNRYVTKPDVENMPESYSHFVDNESYYIVYSQSTYNQILDVSHSSNKEAFINKGEVSVIYDNYGYEIIADNVKFIYGDREIKVTFEKENSSFSYGGMMLTLILNDEDFDELVKNKEIFTKVPGGNDYSPFTGINYENALRSPEFAQKLTETFDSRCTYRVAFEFYNQILGWFGALCFIGYFICAIFILMTASMIYFKQITIATEEKKQYDMLKKIGMDKEEEDKIISKRLIPVFVIPLIIGIIHSLFAMKAADTLILSDMVVAKGSTYLSVVKTSMVMYAIYSLIYLIFYFITKSQYKQTIR